MNDRPKPNVGHEGSEAITALPFEAPSLEKQPSQIKPDPVVQVLSGDISGPWWQSQLKLMLLVFALLGVAGALLFLVTPSPQDSLSLQLETIKESASQAELQASPWEVGQQADARLQAQDILENLLESKKELENRDVQTWGLQPYLAALKLAEQGDEAYKQQEFRAALLSYKQAAQDMEAVFELLPNVIAQQTAQGYQALADGNSALALQHYEYALRLDDKSISAMTGIDRANKLDSALELVSRAQDLEDQFSLNNDIEELHAAQNALLEAQQIDANLEIVNLGLDRIRNAITEQQFKLAMSRAYAALFAGRYSSARSSFADALIHKPGDTTAIMAQKQALAFDKTSSLSNLLNAARDLEKKEQWASALSGYESVLQRDPNQVGAKLARIRSSARLALDNRLRELLSDAMNFGEQSFRDKARQALDDAKALANPGPILKQQISSIERNIQEFEVDQKIVFKSDNVSQIVLRKKGSKQLQLGNFNQKKLLLKPGRYTLYASRLGYRDVSKAIEILPNRARFQEFEVSCTEALVALSSMSEQNSLSGSVGINWQGLSR